MSVVLMQKILHIIACSQVHNYMDYGIWIADVGAPRSKDPKLVIRVITLEVI